MQEPHLPSLDLDIRRLLRRAGSFTVQEFRRFSADRIEYKGERNPFTYVDVTTDTMLREGCEALLPGSGFINEELAAVSSQNGYTWIIDPVDGTVNFIHGIPHYCISLALTRGEEILLGYIYQPVYRQLFRAAKGKGAFLNGKKIRVSDRSETGKSVIATGFPYQGGNERDHHFAILRKLSDTAHGIRRFGSAALDLAWVAAGRFDAFFEYNLSPWDVAAGILIVEEAGGQCSDFSGGNNALFGKQILASNGLMHPHMLEMIGNAATASGR
ncbi:MAG: inositol monophosphatase [Bacteroidetes bacterium]|nr:MAG: inositol monophosphatase [Bacteroidota bacterium]